MVSQHRLLYSIKSAFSLIYFQFASFRTMCCDSRSNESWDHLCWIHNYLHPSGYLPGDHWSRIWNARSQVGRSILYKSTNKLLHDIRSLKYDKQSSYVYMYSLCTFIIYSHYDFSKIIFSRIICFFLPRKYILFESILELIVPQ